MAKGNDWRTNIDAAIRERMESENFRSVGGTNPTFVKELSEDVDIVIQMIQRRRYSQVTVTTIDPLVGIVHKLLADTLEILLQPQLKDKAGPHWTHTNNIFWLFIAPLESAPGRRPWVQVPHSDNDTVAFVINESVAAVTQMELVLQKLKSIDAIVDDMISPSFLKGSVRKDLQRPLALMLCKRYDEAESFVEKHYQKIVEREALEYNEGFVQFRKNFLKEVALRRSEKSS